MPEVSHGTKAELYELDPLELLLSEVQFFESEVRQFHRKHTGEKHICRGVSQEAKFNGTRLIKGFVI